ncbi:Coenzyme F420 hydrogenase/dehydrogenase, beta subunit C-terminal domain [Desulfosporosinus fructosivorans]
MRNNVLTDNSNVHYCTGCSMCAVSCPGKAITIALTKDGFYEPCIDEKLCTNCGLCKKSCYKFDNNVLYGNENSSVVYSAIHKNRHELKSSTSGGVSAELMRECIKQGYKVLGVAYDYQKNIAVTKVASSIEDVEQFKGSKYFQSYTIDAFYKSLNDKSNQKYAIFGTPCQIYAISKNIDLNKDKDKFLLIDIFCHGCPSMNLWTKYLEYTKESTGISQFNRIEFRSKTHAWHEYCFTFHSSNTQYSSKKINDPFYTIFFDKNAFNRVCYNCKMRSSLAYTDIRLGDFWGYQYDTNTTGVSAVVLCSDKGKNLFKDVCNEFETRQHTLEETIVAQSYGKLHSCNDKLRKYTLELLSSDLSMKEVMKAYKRTYSFKKKIKIAAKNSIKHLPQKVYLRIKKIVHEI